MENLGQMRKLKRIALTDRLGNTFIEVLAQYRAARDTSPQIWDEVVCYPKLSHVVLSQVDFDERLLGERTTHETLYHELDRRASSGRPLEWLLLEDCTISERCVDELWGVVWDLAWDDDQGSLEDEDEGITSDSEGEGEGENEYDERHDDRRT